MGFEQCCAFPHGKLSIYTMILGISSYLFAISASWSCLYLKIDGFITKLPPYLIQTGGSTTGLGIWSYEDISTDTWTCIAYSSNQIDALLDGPWRAARAFGILANSLIGISMILLICATCLEFSTRAFKTIATVLALGGIFEILTLLMFASKATDDPMNGSFYIGAYVAVVGGLVSFVTATAVLRLPPVADPFEEGGAPPPHMAVTGVALPFQPGTETVTETVLPDGTKKITKTTVDVNGRNTVEETIIKPEYAGTP